MSRAETVLTEPLAVRAACHARIDFDLAAPQGAELIIEHVDASQLLARECRPLATGACTQDIKTHPAASHIACSIRAGERTLDGVSFSVECGEGIQPTGRHFIVIGAMKAGTTSLFELLAQHPALCRTWAHEPGVSFNKEINYFSHLYREGDKPEHYDWRFPFDAATHNWTLDVSPNYAKWPAIKDVPARIGSLSGETKLAYILREPIDRIESHVAHALHFRGKRPRMAHCIHTSRYAMQLGKFTARFPRGDILLLDFEQLQQDPAAILAQICDFLGIGRFACRTRIHNSRNIEFRLDAEQRAGLAKAVRPDVRRLIRVYGFRPAEKWLHAAPAGNA